MTFVPNGAPALALAATQFPGRPRAAEADPVRIAHRVLSLVRELADRVEDLAHMRELESYQPTERADGSFYDAALRAPALMKALRPPKGLR